MATKETPKLPPLSVNINDKYTYLSTYKVVWNAELQQARKLKGFNKTVGKIICGGKEGLIEWTEDFLEQYPDLKDLNCYRVLKSKSGNKGIYEYKFEPKSEMISLSSAVNLQRLKAGATWTLDSIVANSPLTKALERTFNRYAMHKKLLSLAYYFYLSSNSATHLYEEFAASHRLPFHKPLDSSQISRLFSRITPNDIEKYLKTLNKLVLDTEANNHEKINTYYALDSTSISTHSSSITNAQWGHNKDGDELRQINVLMLVNQETGIPIYYREYAGNTPDVSTVAYTLKEYARLELNRRAILVTDKGYSSISNIGKCLRDEQSFIMNIKTSFSFIKNLIAENYQKLDNICSYNSKLSCYSITRKINWSYPSFYKTKTGRSVHTKTELYMHFYLDPKIKANIHLNLVENIITPILDKLRHGIDLTPEETCYKERFIIDNKDGTFDSNNVNLTRYMLTKGIRVLLSDSVSDNEECWRAYHNRERVEEAFACLKQQTGGYRLRTSKDNTTKGKMFTLFLACSIGLIFRQRIKNTKIKGISLPYDSDSKILAKLNLIEQTIFKEGAIFSEVVGKNREILEALGIPIPNTEYLDEETNEDPVDSDEYPIEVDPLDKILK